jgi:hypothetical protein
MSNNTLQINKKTPKIPIVEKKTRVQSRSRSPKKSKSRSRSRSRSPRKTITITKTKNKTNSKKTNTINVIPYTGNNFPTIYDNLLKHKVSFDDIKQLPPHQISNIKKVLQYAELQRVDDTTFYKFIDTINAL